MEQLIDLSTPKPDHGKYTHYHHGAAQSYSSDFTPTLSKALGECFKRRKQSLLPVAKENQLGMIYEDSDSDRSSLQNHSSFSSSKMGMSPADGLPNFDTPQGNLAKPGLWLDEENNTNNNNENANNPSNNNSMHTSTPQKSSSRTNKKRPPSTPVTPSLFQSSANAKKTKRSVLNSKDSNVQTCTSPSKLWKETERHQTPDSVIQMRQVIKEDTQAMTYIDYYNNNKSANSTTGNETTEGAPGSCSDKLIHENPIDEVLYSKWLTEKHLQELQTVVDFMELEKQYAI